MKFYKATIKGNNITTVMAKDKTAAKVEITRQLNKPGRRGILKQWQENGSKVQVA